MSHCPKCGTKLKKEMDFCPKCGTFLKEKQPTTEATQPAPSEPSAPPPSAPLESYRTEKAEKHEKQEKEEKPEKYEEREYSYIGPFIGGLALIFVGLMLYLTVAGFMKWENIWPLFLIIIGIIIIVGGVYAALIAAKRHPKT